MNWVRLVKWVGAAIALALTACAPSAQQSTNASCRAVTFEAATFTECVADLTRDRVRLVIDPQLRTLHALAEALGANAKVRFAMNGGMYDNQGQPIGLAVVAGRQVHPLNRRHGEGNFHLLPNGVFSVEADGWHVRSSDAYAATPRQPLMATQSGPMLVIGGKLHPAFAPDGDSRYLRNGVGIDRSGKAHFVISDEPVSFGVFARLFRDQLGCPDALFLDGSVSALWDPAAGRIDRSVSLGPLLVVEPR